MTLHAADHSPAPPTKPAGALTPGLAALLDQTCERNRKDEIALHFLGPGIDRGAINPDQDALFDVAQDGTTLVSFDGQTL